MAESIAMAEGDAVIPLGIGGKVGKRFFSEEIAHGLGLGKVTIVLAWRKMSFSSGEWCTVPRRFLTNVRLW